MKTLTTWIGDVYKNHGWVAAVITLAVVVALIVGVAAIAGISVRDVAAWLEYR